MHEILSLIEQGKLDSEVFHCENTLEAKRHTVYSFRWKEMNYMVKVFHRADRFENEMTGQAMAERKGVPVYQIIRQGVTEAKENLLQFF